MILIGHRGAKAHAPENTILGFKNGAKLGANAIEFDVRFTKDKVPVVIHDATVDRTTNGKGKVASFDLNELRKLDAGKGEKIPTLKEALLFCKKQKVTPLIELKEKKHTKIIADTIKKTKTKPIVLSFYPEALKQFKTHAPNIETAFLFSNKIKNVAGFMKLGKVLKASWLFGRKDTVDKKLIETAHKWKFKIAVWVCNTKKEISEFRKLGVDGIASDKPELFKK
jgi:glycerophosphoryl diester phosphodiesterase